MTLMQAKSPMVTERRSMDHFELCEKRLLGVIQLSGAVATYIDSVSFIR